MTTQPSLIRWDLNIEQTWGVGFCVCKVKYVSQICQVDHFILHQTS